MSDGGRDRERAGGRKGRERGGGKKLRGMGEDEPARYKECAAFKKGGREKGKEEASKLEKSISSSLFYYLFISPYLSSFFQTPPIAAGTLVLGPLLPSRSPVPFLPDGSHSAQDSQQV
jgi:hypothetical protein